MPNNDSFLEFSTFFNIVSEKAKTKRIPIGCTFDLTYRCNMRCIHCYVPLHERMRSDAKKELSYSDVCYLLDKIADAGCLRVKFSGGEPLFRHDFIDIYCYAKKKGFLIDLYTNGTLIDSKIVKILTEYPIYLVEISMYGSTKETYEGITKIDGSFNKCLNGIRMLKEAGLNVILKAPILINNVDDIENLQKLASDFNCQFIYSPEIIPSLDGSLKQCNNLNISIEEMAKVRAGYNKKLNRDEILTKSYDRKNMFICQVGRSAFHINAYGELQICLFYKTKDHFNLLKRPFLEGWNGFIKDLIDKKLDDNCKCVSCEHRLLCDYCPGKESLYKNSSIPISDFYCKLTNLIILEGNKS